jgi:hypothetical protein
MTCAPPHCGCVMKIRVIGMRVASGARDFLAPAPAIALVCWFNPTSQVANGCGALFGTGLDGIDLIQLAKDRGARDPVQPA